MTNYQRDVLRNYASHIATGVRRVRQADEQTIGDVITRIRRSKESLFGTHDGSKTGVFEHGPTVESIILFTELMELCVLKQCGYESRGLTILNKALEAV